MKRSLLLKECIKKLIDEARYGIDKRNPLHQSEPGDHTKFYTKGDAPTDFHSHQPKLELTGPVQPMTGRVKNDSHKGTWTIYRYLTLAVTPESLKIMHHLDNMTRKKALKTGVVEDEFEIGIVFESDYTEAVPARRGDPDEPEYFDVTSWAPVSLAGMLLSPEDRDHLLDYITSELTEDENEQIRIDYIENRDGGEDPRIDDYEFDRRGY